MICAAPLCPANHHINANAPTTPFPHFWKEMFGSGRGALVLRQSYLNDLKAVKQVTSFKYVRFHAILHDELGVYNEDEHGNPVYNFAYVNQIYDNLLANGVRPVVEISFMPKKLAFNPDTLHPFWYKQNVREGPEGHHVDEAIALEDCVSEGGTDERGVTGLVMTGDVPLGPEERKVGFASCLHLVAHFDNGAADALVHGEFFGHAGSSGNLSVDLGGETPSSLSLLQQPLSST